MTGVSLTQIFIIFSVLPDRLSDYVRRTSINGYAYQGTSKLYFRSDFYISGSLVRYEFFYGFSPQCELRTQENRFWSLLEAYRFYRAASAGGRGTMEAQWLLPESTLLL